MDAKTPLASDAGFRPETFFVGRTEGAGVVRDVAGRVARRCTILTLGTRREADGALRFDETFTYDDGEVDIWRWTMTPGCEGRYMVAESSAGSGIVGHRVGEDYVVSFHRAVGRDPALRSLKFTTRFTLVAPDLALKAVKITKFGAPMAAMAAFHRRVAG